MALTLTGWKLENIRSDPPFDEYHGWDFLEDGEGYYKEVRERMQKRSLPRPTCCRSLVADIPCCFLAILIRPQPNGHTHIESIYETASPGYRADWEGRGMRPYYSVPLLYNEQTKTIVSTESAEIIVMLNSAFDSLPSVLSSVDLDPPSSKSAQATVNAIVYPGISSLSFAATVGMSDVFLRELGALKGEGVALSG